MQSGSSVDLQPSPPQEISEANLSSSTKSTLLHSEGVFFYFLAVRRLVFKNHGKK